MQSAWYTYWGTFPRSAGSDMCHGCDQGATFREALENSVQRAKQDPPAISGWLWDSMYARHLEAYLGQFDASNFLLVPYRYYTEANSTLSLCQTVSQAVGTSALNCVDQRPSQKSMHIEHPPLMEDLSTRHLNSFNELMGEENGWLVRTIAKAHQTGARLFNYVGQPGVERDVKGWLERGW